jgi:hypothetical protein
MKRLFIILVLFLNLYTKGFSQSFFNEFKKYLQSQRYCQCDIKPTVEYTAYQEKTTRIVNTLTELFKSVKIVDKVSMLNTDTLYMLLIPGGLGSEVRMLVWNKQYSCSYFYSFEWEKRIKSTEKIVLNIDASQSIKSMKPDFLNLVKTADTLNIMNMLNHIKVHLTAIWLISL